eukprot:CFRG2400T1
MFLCIVIVYIAFSIGAYGMSLCNKVINFNSDQRAVTRTQHSCNDKIKIYRDYNIVSAFYDSNSDQLVLAGCPMYEESADQLEEEIEEEIEEELVQSMDDCKGAIMSRCTEECTQQTAALLEPEKNEKLIECLRMCIDDFREAIDDPNCQQ